MSLVRMHIFSISLDGFGTGEGQQLKTPFDHAGSRPHGVGFQDAHLPQDGFHGEAEGFFGADGAFTSK